MNKPHNKAINYASTVPDVALRRRLLRRWYDPLCQLEAQ